MKEITTSQHFQKVLYLEIEYVSKILCFASVLQFPLRKGISFAIKISFALLKLNLEHHTNLWEIKNQIFLQE